MTGTVSLLDTFCPDAGHFILKANFRSFDMSDVLVFPARRYNIDHGVGQVAPDGCPCGDAI